MMAQTNKYSGAFRKKDGSERQMTFFRVAELTEEQKGKIGLIPGASANRQIYLQPGFEIVFDLDANDFRTFNWNSIIGQVQKQQVEF
jgi:hypothetical protein